MSPGGVPRGQLRGLKGLCPSSPAGPGLHAARSNTHSLTVPCEEGWLTPGPGCTSSRVSGIICFWQAPPVPRPVATIQVSVGAIFWLQFLSFSEHGCLWLDQIGGGLEWTVQTNEAALLGAGSRRREAGPTGKQGGGLYAVFPSPCLPVSLCCAAGPGRSGSLASTRPAQDFGRAAVKAC